MKDPRKNATVTKGARLALVTRTSKAARTKLFGGEGTTPRSTTITKAARVRKGKRPIRSVIGALLGNDHWSESGWTVDRRVSIVLNEYEVPT